MHHSIPRLAVSLSDATTRRGFLGQAYRVVLGVGLGVTALAGGGPAFGNVVCQRVGGHSSGCGGTTGCSGVDCGTDCDYSNFVCGPTCNTRTSWSCCCNDGTNPRYLNKCLDCFNCPNHINSQCTCTFININSC